MVSHQNVAIELDTVDIQGLAENLEEFLPIAIITENVLSLITSAGDVIHRSWIDHP